MFEIEMMLESSDFRLSEIVEQNHIMAHSSTCV